MFIVQYYSEHSIYPRSVTKHKSLFDAYDKIHGIVSELAKGHFRYEVELKVYVIEQINRCGFISIVDLCKNKCHSAYPRDDKIILIDTNKI